MDDKIIKIEFNIYANSDEEGQILKKAICDFIDWHGKLGRKVSAIKLADAINKWQENPFVKSKIIDYFK